MNQLKAYCERPSIAEKAKKRRDINLLNKQDRKLAARFYCWAGKKRECEVLPSLRPQVNKYKFFMMMM